MNKGFTLVEILAVIVILTIIMIISIKSISGIRNQQLQKVNEEKIESLAKSAVLYAQDNPNIFLDSNIVCSNSNYNETNTPGISNYKNIYNDCVIIDGHKLANENYIESDNINGETIIRDNTVGCNILNYNIILYRDNNRINSYVAINENTCNTTTTTTTTTTTNPCSNTYTSCYWTSCDSNGRQYNMCQQYCSNGRPLGSSYQTGYKACGTTTTNPCVNTYESCYWGACEPDGRQYQICQQYCSNGRPLGSSYQTGYKACGTTTTNPCLNTYESCYWGACEPDGRQYQICQQYCSNGRPLGSSYQTGYKAC